MIVYNVTVKVVPEIHDEWLEWMREYHIPEVLNTGAFLKCRISKLDIAEDDGITYSIQYDSYSQEMLTKYMSLHAPAIQKKHIEKYANRFVAFRTIMNVVEELYPLGTRS
ncbi:MAG: DUF4286 family protein [Bacteroidota bacterium]|nr:DUF4286 family protein [Bacteroidota bacterium]